MTDRTEPMAFSLRRAAPEDAPAIRRFDPHFRADELTIERTRNVVVVARGVPQAIGWGGAFPDNPADAGSFRLHLAIHPDWRGRGAGGVLLAHLLEWLGGMQASVAHVRIPEIDDRILRFFLKHGFVENRRMWRLLLAVQEVDVTRFEPLLERVRAQGIQIASMEDEQGKGVDFLKAWYDLLKAEESQYHSYVEFLEWGFQRGIVPGSCFFARVQDQYVGYNFLSFLGTEGDPGLLEQGYIRVREPFKNQGIATALTVRIIDYAKRHNYRAIQSHVSDKNAPMLAVNTKLDFRRAGGEIWVRKRLV